jgi:hypothetical protein
MSETRAKGMERTTGGSLLPQEACSWRVMMLDREEGDDMDEEDQACQWRLSNYGTF